MRPTERRRSAAAIAVALAAACQSSAPAPPQDPGTDGPNAGDPSPDGSSASPGPAPPPPEAGSSFDASPPGPPSDGGPIGRDAPASDDGGIGGDRPVAVHVPPGYVAGTPAPLVMMLHGYTASGAGEESYLGLTAQSDARGFLYAYPDGTVDSFGNRFWNATDACCDLAGTHVDDATYLNDVITQIAARYTVDPKRVFLIGHSNGGFMSYRMACDHGDRIAAIVSLAGAMWSDLSKCAAKSPVAVLEVHGTADDMILFGGGTILASTYPSAATSVSDWVGFDGCAPTPDTSAPPLDLESTLAGAETTITRYAGCKPGGAAELWTMQGAGHVPTFTPDFAKGAIDFMYAHPKP